MATAKIPANVKKPTDGKRRAPKPKPPTEALCVASPLPASVLDEAVYVDPSTLDPRGVPWGHGASPSDARS